jgi:hypothetical protein
MATTAVASILVLSTSLMLVMPPVVVRRVVTALRTPISSATLGASFMRVRSYMDDDCD